MDFSKMVVPNIHVPTIPINPNLASEFYDRLMSSIAEFEKNLDDTFEVGAKLVNYGASLVIHLNGLGYHNPSLIKFYGTLENGEEVELIQHVSQINVLLVRVKRTNLNVPKRRIGIMNDDDPS